MSDNKQEITLDQLKRVVKSLEKYVVEPKDGLLVWGFTEEEAEELKSLPDYKPTEGYGGSCNE